MYNINEDLNNNGFCMSMMKKWVPSHAEMQMLEQNKKVREDMCMRGYIAHRHHHHYHRSASGKIDVDHFVDEDDDDDGNENEKSLPQSQHDEHQ